MSTDSPRRRGAGACWGTLVVALAMLALLPGRGLGASEDAAGPPLHLQQCDLVVRPPTLFRLSLSRSLRPGEPGREAMVIEITLAQGQSLLASDRIELAHLSDLAQGLSVALAPSGLDGAQGAATVSLRVSLLTLQAPQLGAPYVPVEEIVREVPTPRTLAARLDRVHARLLEVRPSAPLPWLWEEQAQEIASGPTSIQRCSDLMRLLERLDTALAPGAAPVSADGPLRAYRDPCDGSVQPERHYLPAGPLRGTVWLLSSPERAPLKCDWAEPDPALIGGAAQAGLELVQLYPAGDLGWDGAALLRAWRRLQAQAPGPVLLIGQGRGAVGALRLLALSPSHVGAVRLLDPQLGDSLDPLLMGWSGVSISGHADAAWSHLTPALPTCPGPSSSDFWQLGAGRGAERARPLAQVLPQLATPATHYCLGRFVVVVGLGEHAAAQEDDRALAEAFCHAWARHAHALPPCLTDVEFQAADWRDATWILIGNPRSNRVLASLTRHHPLPVSWDSRTLTFQGVTSLRSDRRPVALAATRRDDGQAIVLDGGVSWAASGLPLVGVPLPYVGAAAVATPPATPSPGAPAPGPMMAPP